jgi:hypothetical protein
VQQYSAIDNHPFTGTSFYRIKQVDVDGHATYSKIVRINILNPTLHALNVYPTVTSNVFTVRVQNKGTGKRLIMQVVSAAGKLVQEQTVSLREGENKFSYSLAGEARGVYYIRMLNEAEQTSLAASIIKK